MRITKSLFVEFLQCPKLAWFHMHEKEKYNLIQEHLYGPSNWECSGQEVENCVKKLFDSVVEIQNKENISSAIDATKEVINQNSSVLYQPRFEYKDAIMRADFLVLHNGKYDLVEVKSKNNIRKPTKAQNLKDDLVADLSYQAYLLRKSLWEKFSGKAYLCYLNKNYIKRWEVDIPSLIKQEEVSSELWGDEKVENILQEMLGVLQKEKSDFEAIYPYNNEDYVLYFWEPAPKGSIWYIPWIWNRKKSLYELWKTDVLKLGNKEKQLLLSAKWEVSKPYLYVEDYQNHQRRIEKSAIQKKLSQLEYPLYFYDYETITTSVPLFDGTSPRSQVPVQYSLHKIEEDGTVTHKEALIEWVIKDNRAIIEQLYKDLEWGKQWTFIVWFKGFENSRNDEMAELYPEYKDFFAKVNARTFDLMEIFSKGHFFDRNFLGSASIKKVLPVLTELTYEWMNIPNGWIATDVIFKIATGLIEGEELITARKDLLEYCKQDTWAMVRIWQEVVNLLS